MASKVINTIRNDVTSMKLNLVEIISKDEKIKKILKEEDENIKKKNIDELIDKKAKKGCESIHNKISASIKNIKCETDKIIPTLLSEDTKGAVADMCCKISYRLSVDKIVEWCKANLLMEAIKSDIRNKIQHTSKSEINVEPPLKLNSSYWISQFRRTVAKIHLKSYEFDQKSIQTLCLNMTNLVANDISEAMKKIVLLLSVDLCIGLIVHYPENCCENLFHYFDQFWTNCPRDILICKLLLCAQNLKFLWTGHNIKLSQSEFVVLLNKLLLSQHFSLDDLDSVIKDLKEEGHLDLKYSTFLEKDLRAILYHTSKF